MDACAQTGIAYQLLRRWKAGDITNGSENGHRRHELNTGQLDEQGHAGVGSSSARERIFELRHLGFGKRQRREVGLNTRLFEHGHW
jgi:hypothetical protein